MSVTSETLLRDIAIRFSTAIPVLERFGIADCCEGEISLAEACAIRKLELAPVLEELKRQEEMTGRHDASWETVLLHELTEYIVRKHHAFTREQVNVIEDLLANVESIHGNDHPEVFQVSKAFAVITSALMRHFYCEENILFPYMDQLATSRHPVLPPVFASLREPVARLRREHVDTGIELCKLREITNNYVSPTAASPTWRVLYQAMEDLERDLHQHIHLENNILFPRALEQMREAA